MNVKIEPLKVEELDDYITLFWNAMEPLEANMIAPMIYLNGLQPDVLQRFRERWLRNADIPNECFVARDTITGEITGVSWWQADFHPPQTREEIDAAFEKAKIAKAKLPPAHDMNTAIDDAYFKAAFYGTADTTEGRPYMELRLLAVDTKHHRRGIGSLLLRHGLEKADELGLQVYLDSAVMGKALYERHGFEFARDLDFNGLEYGGRSDGKHWCMLRPVQGSKSIYS